MDQLPRKTIMRAVLFSGFAIINTHTHTHIHTQSPINVLIGEQMLPSAGNSFCSDSDGQHLRNTHYHEQGTPNTDIFDCTTEQDSHELGHNNSTTNTSFLLRNLHNNTNHTQCISNVQERVKEWEQDIVNGNIINTSDLIQNNHNKNQTNQQNINTVSSDETTGQPTAKQQQPIKTLERNNVNTIETTKNNSSNSTEGDTDPLAFNGIGKSRLFFFCYFF